MKYGKFILIFGLVLTVSCSKKTIEYTQSCARTQLNDDVGYNDLVSGIPLEVITKLVKRPDEKGALGRNGQGYFHVRFQFEMTRLSDYAVRVESEQAVSEYLKNLDYSFSFQKEAGDFQFIPPNDLPQDLGNQVPSEGNLASATAFFAYSVGVSLATLNQSGWYTSATTLTPIKNKIHSFDPQIKSMLGYLKESVDLLNRVDRKAPNRLLFNAIAFYSLGIHLGDTEAMEIGLRFVRKALSQRAAGDGYFIEANGWDSSYNGVSTKLALELFTLMRTSSPGELKGELEAAIFCSAEWQASRVLPTGEISTDKNTRVFPGGENFLGKEKEVDVIKTVKAFYYMNVLADDERFKVLAEKVLGFYVRH